MSNRPSDPAWIYLRLTDFWSASKGLREQCHHHDQMTGLVNSQMPVPHIHHNVFQHTVSSLIKMVCKTSHAYPRESKCVHKFVLASNSWLWKRQIAHGEPLGTILHWWILKVCGLDAYYAGLDLDGFWHSKLTLKIQIRPFNIYIPWFLKIKVLRNQGLLQTLEKFEALQTWIFFFSLSPRFFSDLYHRPEKNPGDKLKKIQVCRTWNFCKVWNRP